MLAMWKPCRANWLGGTARCGPWLTQPRNFSSAHRCRFASAPPRTSSWDRMSRRGGNLTCSSTSSSHWSSSSSSSSLSSLLARLPGSRFHQMRARHRGEFPITWRTLAVTAVVAGAGLWYLQREKQAMDRAQAERQATRQDASFGKPKVGGPFRLVNADDGKEVTDRDFRGRFMIIYFGFTHCPDVCPDELDKMAKAITKMDGMTGVGDMVVPVFVSVDPKRDSPQVVKQYIQGPCWLVLCRKAVGRPEVVDGRDDEHGCVEFHPRFVGLTGTEEQVQEAAKAYRIYISRGEPTSDDDYLVDHSIFFFLINPDGEFSDFFGRNATADDIAMQCARAVRTWKQDKTAGRI